MMEWSPQQENAIRSATEWLKTKQQVYKIFGYAGTGKTTLAREIASKVKGSVCYGAFTGKAASVMRKKGCDDASTIHSLIYTIDEDTENTDSPRFILNPKSEVKKSDLVIIDECSMVDEILGRDLLSFGVKVLVLGDPAQLPPVSGAGYFTNGSPDQMLTEVHRQARDNPIIRLSMDIREGRKVEPGQYGASQVITVADLNPDEVLDADQVIVGLNRTRVSYNARMRQKLNRQPGTPVRGDKLICLRNDRAKGIYNGTMWEVEKCNTYHKKRPIYHMLLSDLDEGQVRKKGVQVRHEFFDGRDSDLAWHQKKGTQDFTFGYAITCHKSQGSQWNHIVVFDEGGSFREDAARWRYTAVTRAAEKLTLVV